MTNVKSRKKIPAWIVVALTAVTIVAFVVGTLNEYLWLRNWRGLVPLILAVVLMGVYIRFLGLGYPETFKPICVMLIIEWVFLPTNAFYGIPCMAVSGPVIALSILYLVRARKSGQTERRGGMIACLVIGIAFFLASNIR